MSDCYEQSLELRALAMRVAALEDNVAFLEQWCEEQQDALDRVTGPAVYDYEVEPPSPRQILRVVDLRDGMTGDADTEVEGPLPGPADAEGGIDVAVLAVVETEHERRLRQIRAHLNRLRRRLALSVAPAEGPPPPPEPEHRPLPRAGVPVARRVSAKQAGRTAP